MYIVDLLPQPLVWCERENLGGVVGDAGRIFKNRIRVSGYLIANVDSVFFYHVVLLSEHRIQQMTGDQTKS